jgi:hypothetical protein
MRFTAIVLLVLIALPVSATGQPGAPAPAAEPPVISEGREAILVDHLKPEGPTVVLFYRPGNPDDVDLFEAVRNRSRQDNRVALRVVRLAGVDAPIARQYEVTAAPMAFVYDRNKNLIGRSGDLGRITELVARGLRTARIKWIDESDERAAEVYKMFGGGQGRVPEIIKTMSLEPELMEAIANVAQRFHFRDGYLPRRTKEMVASYVSALNKCKY